MTTTAATAARTTPTHVYRRGTAGPWCHHPDCGLTYYEHPLVAADEHVEIAGRRLADLTHIDDLGADPAGHDHSLDAIVGYVLRQTVLGGNVLPDGGYDFAACTDPAAYAAALDVAWTFRHRQPLADWAWAVVDRVYACGCRS